MLRSDRYQAQYQCPFPNNVCAPEKFQGFLQLLRKTSFVIPVRFQLTLKEYKLSRLAEFIQEGFPEKIVDVFKYSKDESLAKRLAITSKAIAFHQGRAEALWTQAGKKRTTEERQAAAQAEIASFLFAYLTGEAKEHADSSIEAMRALGREGELDIVTSLSRS